MGKALAASIVSFSNCRFAVVTLKRWQIAMLLPVLLKLALGYYWVQVASIVVGSLAAAGCAQKCEWLASKVDVCLTVAEKPFSFCFPLLNYVSAEKAL